MSVLLVDDHGVVREGYRRLLERQGDIAFIGEAQDAAGRFIKEIAESLGLNPKTVAKHQSASKQKLGADTAIQLLRKASQLGLEPPA